ncbi:nicotinate (nicotinamide) nucleotide adenylyltransferase [Sneathiella marina]|uniref:Probable nicotinate-nucleotide adenylyltransferase n=1 Tax=Sneathiella marina TaxID=2950108 RepID=A0ABY4W4D3_9PROT|nr:nicotinate (nicotinamide) nucleotide adenylyltransferase [Sneathiella marina]USG61696.1 nicotinate (nicotinamide) nucleotide adenylyltransferase [Sneathiella marina]
MRPRKIGILGGSFNPAHQGHRDISLTALRLLALDEVWWLVSPQNPLKTSDGMGDFRDRMAGAKKIAKHPNIKVSDFETRINEPRTAKMLPKLIESYPDCQFVWLMGADNLVQFPKWYRWENIMDTVPIAVFNRPGYTYQALNGPIAQKFREYRLFPAAEGKPIPHFASSPPPCWVFVSQTAHKISSTHIRNFRDRAGNTCS